MLSIKQRHTVIYGRTAAGIHSELKALQENQRAAATRLGVGIRTQPELHQQHRKRQVFSVARDHRADCRVFGNRADAAVRPRNARARRRPAAD